MPRFRRAESGQVTFMLFSVRPLAGALGVLLALLLTGCGGDGSSAPSAGSPTSSGSTSSPASATPSPTATTDPDFQAPAVGQCRRLKASDIPPPSNDSPTVACSSPHTAVTVAVFDVPKRLLPAGKLTRRQHRKLFDYMGPRCTRAWNRAEGGTAILRRKSLASEAWFYPTPKQRAHGARWVRCDVMMQTGSPDTTSSGHLLALPAHLPILHGSTVPARYSRCLAGTQRLYPVACTQPHTFRLSAVVAYRHPSTSKPAPAAVNAIGKRLCQPVAQTSTFAWTSPSDTDWSTGKPVYFTCYDQATGSAT